MDCSTPGLSVPHHLSEFAQVHIHWIGDAIRPGVPRKPTAKGKFSHPLRRSRKIRTDTPKPPLSNKCSASLKAVGMPMKREWKIKSPNSTLARVTSLQAINIGEYPEEKESPKAVGGYAHWHQSPEWTVFKCLKNYEVRPSLGSDIPAPWPASWAHHQLKGTCTPTNQQHCFLPVAETRSLQNPQWETKP